VSTKSQTFERTLQLPEVLDMNAAAPLAGELVTYRGGDLQADASQVQRIGGQGIQVLLSALATWQQDGFRFSVVNPSAAFTDIIGVLGLNESELLGKG
jgi:chemotaxis protein CheX